MDAILSIVAILIVVVVLVFAWVGPESGPFKAGRPLAPALLMVGGVLYGVALLTGVNHWF